ncbi:hypothetical protein HQ393_13355 [Chitinibacter bivalviorum]|uniref:SF3 helicase domain-containing protein n=1 Tax=Chitinibacter bivalviorum TaxID=2739434 RepID=A0A7H9BKX0_9NEIS|nr:phage/plasmid primase, P4 family [Chitinibacter bivalviorum]QLG88418.1 hypothetical protein HQ393_09240 [Chitinibacter bivalviorum]QLG89149.1 hypothetical protein HQ393_13355 [Chitinibacter bivalviorum]
MKNKVTRESIDLQFAKTLKESEYYTTGGVVYKWTGSHYQAQTQLNLENAALNFLIENFRDKATANKARACTALLRAFLPKLPISQITDACIPTETQYIAVGCEGDAMGVKSLMPPDKNRAMTYAINCDFDEKRNFEGSKFQKFIEQILPDTEIRQLVQEYIGYSLQSKLNYQVMQLWLGSGKNGKSTLLDIVCQLHQKTCALELDRLDPQHLPNVIGASLCFSDEVPKSGINEQKLKMLISGGVVEVKILYKDPVSYASHRKFIVCANHFPKVKDQSNGFWRRQQIIPFNAKIEKPDPLLAKNIITNELNVVLNWAIEGLIQLIKRGQFIVPKAVHDAIEEAKTSTDSVRSWIKDTGLIVSMRSPMRYEWKQGFYKCDEKFLNDEGHYEANQKFDRSYIGWCKANGNSPVSQKEFWSRIAAYFKESGAEFTESTNRIIKGDAWSNGSNYCDRRRRRVNLMQLDPCAIPF